MNFYRPMHFSAKCGLAVACRPSVRLSVTLVDCDHKGWNSLKIISHLVNVGRSLSADRNIIALLEGEQPEIWAQSDPPPVDLSVGDIRLQIVTEWLQIVQWSQSRTYRKPPSLFRSQTPLVEGVNLEYISLGDCPALKSHTGR